MLSLIMFAMIGAALDLGAWYWVVYGCYAVFSVISVIGAILKD